MAWSSASAHRNAAHMACGAEQLVSGAEMGAHTVGLGPGTPTDGEADGAAPPGATATSSLKATTTPPESRPPVTGAAAAGMWACPLDARMQY